MTAEPYDYYKCQCQSCVDNGGGCLLRIPIGAENPQECINPNNDDIDCQWLPCKNPYVDVLDELEQWLDNEIYCCGYRDPKLDSRKNAFKEVEMKLSKLRKAGE